MTGSAFVGPASGRFTLVLVDSDEDNLREMQDALEVIGRERTLRGLKLDAVRGDDVAPDSTTESGAADTEQEAPVTLLRVTRNRSTHAAIAQACKRKRSNSPQCPNARQFRCARCKSTRLCCTSCGSDDHHGFVKGARSLRDVLCKSRDAGRLPETDGRCRKT